MKLRIKKINGKIFTLFALLIIFNLFYIYTNREAEIFKYGYEWMNFLKDFSIVVLIGVILHYFLILRPRKSKKKLIKEVLMSTYRNFKVNSIRLFLQALEDKSELDIDVEKHNEDSLCEEELFKKVFMDSSKRTKWDSIMDKFEGNHEYVNDFKIELKLLKNEIDFALSNINSYIEPSIFMALKEKSMTLQDLEYFDCKDSELKALFRSTRAEFTKEVFYTKKGERIIDIINKI
jgi:preprotein translocase subunit YajC